MFYQIVACTLMTCFYVTYFCKQISLRKKGIQANRMAKGIKLPRTVVIEKYLMAATYGSVAAQYVSVFWGSYLFPFPFPVPIRIVGIAFAACGIVFFILAITNMRDSWRAGVDESQKTSLVTLGVYKLSRNPAFVGFDFLYIGVALALSNAVLMVLMVITIILLHMQILEEEKYLSKVFREEYMNYKASTPRYLFF